MYSPSHTYHFCQLLGHSNAKLFIHPHENNKDIIISYIKNLKVIIDNLVLIDYSLNNEKVILRTLNNLWDEYKELAITIRAWNSPLSFEELYNKLFDQESFLKWERNKGNTSNYNPIQPKV